MNVDMRKFSYCLDAVSSKAVWELDASLLELRAQHLRLDACETALEKALNERAEAMHSMQHVCQMQIDPTTYYNVLRHLLVLDARLTQMKAERDEAKQALTDVRDACAACQGRLDQLEAHRGEQLAEFVKTEQAREFAILDSEWLQRAGWLKSNGVQQYDSY